MNGESPILNKIRKFILVALVMLIIITGWFLIDSLRSTKSLENKAATPIAGQCLQAEDFCTWEALGGSGIEYDYKIIDKTTTEDIVVSEGSTSNTAVEFQPIANHKYLCQVKARQDCKSSPDFSTSSISICATGNNPPAEISEKPTIVVSATPTVSSVAQKVIKIVQLSPTPKVASVIENAPTSSLGATLSPISTKTPTPTLVKSSPSPSVVASIIPTTPPEQLPNAGATEWMYGTIALGLFIVFLGFAL